MKTHQILYKHTGGNSDTAKSPVAVWEEQADLSEQIRCCLNWDDNRIMPTDKWAVHEVALPDWLRPEEWIQQTVAWTWAWGLGMASAWPERWQRAIVYSDWSEAERLAVIKLLKVKKFRSSFRQSLRDQLESWLDTLPDERKYDSPFSHKQWQALVNRWVDREAQSRSSGMYYGYRYSIMQGV